MSGPVLSSPTTGTALARLAVKALSRRITKPSRQTDRLAVESSQPRALKALFFAPVHWFRRRLPTESVHSGDGRRFQVLLSLSKSPVRVLRPGRGKKGGLEEIS